MSRSVPDQIPAIDALLDDERPSMAIHAAGKQADLRHAAFAMRRASYFDTCESGESIPGKSTNQ